MLLKVNVVGQKFVISPSVPFCHKSFKMRMQIPRGVQPWKQVSLLSCGPSVPVFFEAFGFYVYNYLLGSLSMWTAVSVAFHTPGSRDLNVSLSPHTDLPQRKKGCAMPSIMFVLGGYNQREIVTGTRMCCLSRAGSKQCLGFVKGKEQTDQSNLGKLDYTFTWV